MNAQQAKTALQSNIIGAAAAVSASNSLNELNQLRQEAAKKERLIEELQKRERELLGHLDQIKSDLSSVREQVAVRKTTAAAGEESTRLYTLEAEIKRKDREMRDQEQSIKSLVQQWEAECEVRITNNLIKS